MRTNPACVAILLFAVSSPVHAQTSAGKSVPCNTQNPADGRHTYVDRVHGFCFQYPSSYKRLPSAKNQAIQFKSLHSDAYIFVSFENKPFNLQRFAERAPTGVESPPSPVQVGEYTFYYYGPGGGGVSYPDLYFFNLRGKTLHITFDGPYIHDKTPSAETKKLERELLATFRLFED
jgi:hypothetical protein